MTSRYGGRRGGFSLVEAVCAILILGVGVAGLTEAITVALRSSKESERGTVAPLLAAGQLEKLRAEGYVFEGEEEGEFGEEFPRYAWRQSVARASLDGLYEVSVTVLDAQTDEEIYELRTLLFDQPISYSGEEGLGGSGGSAASRRTGGGRR